MVESDQVDPVKDKTSYPILNELVFEVGIKGSKARRRPHSSISEMSGMRCRTTVMREHDVQSVPG